MIRAIIFDCLGVLESGGGANQELLDYIRRELKPQYRLGLLTNVSPRWLDDFLSENNLHSLFDHVMIASDAGFRKPHPSAYTDMAERLGLEPADCMMIDDSPDNRAGAEAVGMRAVLFTSNHALFDTLATLQKPGTINS